MTLLESPEDEQILIGTLISLTNNDPDIIDRISPAHLSGVRATIWETARKLRADNKSCTSRAIAAVHHDNQSVRGELQRVAGQSWPAGRIAEAERTVVELGKLRRLQGALTAAQERIGQGSTYATALEAAHSELGRLEEATQSGVVDFSQAYANWEGDQRTRPAHSHPIPTPWEGLDSVLSGGLRRGRTYVVGARPGGGKSIAGVNLATYAAQQLHPSLIFSVEMAELEVTSRVIAGAAAADYGQMTRRDIDAYNWDRIQGWRESHPDIPLGLIDRSDIGVEYVSAVCRARKRSHGLDVVFVDYLQLLKPGGGKESRERQIAEMSRSLKVLANDLDVAVIIACQLNRNSANEKRPPTLADLRESGSIEQDADVVMLMHHYHLDDGSHSGDVDVVVAKNRTGPLSSVRLGWRPYQGRFVS